MDAWGETDDNRWTILYFLILIHFGLNNKIIDISCQREESGPLRKKVWLPPQMFEFVSDVPNVATSEYCWIWTNNKSFVLVTARWLTWPAVHSGQKGLLFFCSLYLSLCPYFFLKTFPNVFCSLVRSISHFSLSVCLIFINSSSHGNYLIWFSVLSYIYVHVYVLSLGVGRYRRTKLT